jgi:hypothetical protein
MFQIKMIPMRQPRSRAHGQYRTVFPFYSLPFSTSVQTGLLGTAALHKRLESSSIIGTQMIVPSPPGVLIELYGYLFGRVPHTFCVGTCPSSILDRQAIVERSIGLCLNLSCGLMKGVAQCLDVCPVPILYLISLTAS